MSDDSRSISISIDSVSARRTIGRRVQVAPANRVLFAALQVVGNLLEGLVPIVGGVVEKDAGVVLAVPKAGGAGQIRAEPIAKQAELLIVVEQQDLQSLVGNLELHAVGIEAKEEAFIDRFEQLDPLVGPGQLAALRRVGRVVHQHKVLARAGPSCRPGRRTCAFQRLAATSRRSERPSGP